MPSNKPKLAILGAGHMGSALISGLIARDYPAQQIWASDHSHEKLEHLKKKFAISTVKDNKAAINQAQVIICAVKPAYLCPMLQELAADIQAQKPLIISIAAGVTEKRIQDSLGGKAAIVRCMPNTPALIGCGASALFANGFTSPAQRNLAESILSSVGLSLWLENEKQLDTVTALSGSGPAYFFLLIEAMQEAGEALGLSEETARLLTLQTAYGAARLALESGEHIVELRHRVTSPGGTTEHALQVLEKGIFKQLINQAIRAAKLRAEELSKEK